MTQVRGLVVLLTYGRTCKRMRNWGVAPSEQWEIEAGAYLEIGSTGLGLEEVGMGGRSAVHAYKPAGVV